MRPPRVTLAAVLAAFVAAASAAEKPAVFRFDPGDGRSWTETTHVSITSWPRQEGDRPFETERVDRLTARRSEAGWEITVDPVSERLDARGRPVVDPIVTAYGGRVRGLTLDAAGAVIGVRLAQEPATESDRVREIAGPEAVDKVLGDVWRRLGGGLAGQKGARGTLSSGRLDVALAAGGSVTYKTTWSIGESVPCEAGSCVRVNIGWTADLTPLFMAQQKDVASRWAGAAVNPSGLQRWYVKGKGRLLVHPDGIRVLRRSTEEKLSVEAATSRESPAIREVVEVRETVASPEAPAR